jgi:hypothetical protein
MRHPAHQLTLRTVQLRQRPRQRSCVITPLRPVRALPEVNAFAGGLVGEHAVIMRRIHRKYCGE